MDKLIFHGRVVECQGFFCIALPIIACEKFFCLLLFHPGGFLVGQGFFDCRGDVFRALRIEKEGALAKNFAERRDV